MNFDPQNLTDRPVMMRTLKARRRTAAQYLGAQKGRVVYGLLEDDRFTVFKDKIGWTITGPMQIHSMREGWAR